MTILSLPVFLASVFFISLSGVMMPGPVFAVTLAKGHANRKAGALIAIGHGLVEIPLMTLIYLGFAQFFSHQVVRTGLGVVGGTMLIYMGCQMFRLRKQLGGPHRNLYHSSVVAGVLTTFSNPYFFLWWATIGVALVMNSMVFGLFGFVLFAVVHWLCDFSWDFAVSATVFKSRRLWTERVHEIVFALCSFLLLGFGAWFVLSTAIPA